MDYLTWSELRAVTKLHVESCNDCHVYPYGWQALGYVSLCETGLSIQFSHVRVSA